MNTKLPFTLNSIESIIEKHPTPFHIYDEERIRSTARTLSSTMSEAGVQGFRNYFAVKALPNPSVLRILVDEGMGLDCSSLAELALADMLGVKGDDIIFTSNNTSPEEFAYAQKLEAIINFDDVSLVAPFIEQFGAPRVACCRFNPGSIEFGGVNEAIIGSPKEAKYGMPLDDLIEAYRQLLEAGTEQFGLHTMLLSNELDWRHHERIADAVFVAAKEIAEHSRVSFSFINLGGGIGVPYYPDEHEFDIAGFASSLSAAYERHDMKSLGNPRIVMENGRYITADAGYLVTRVVNEKRTHKRYIGVDATMSDLMRPGMYGAYHYISVPGKEDQPLAQEYDITGSLCENNDKFAIDRALPELHKGDVLVIHTTGAHGHAMGFQYNGKLRHAELLLHPDETVTEIRRAETLDDYFETLTEKGEYHV